jgi:hypothetical protein
MPSNLAKYDEEKLCIGDNSLTIFHISLQKHHIISTDLYQCTSGIGKATRHAQLALPSRLWRIEVRYLYAHVCPVNSD